MLQPSKKARSIEQIRLDLIDSLDDARPLVANHVSDLTESIRDHGLLQPVVVIRSGERFIIPIGNHRKAACELAGMSYIEAEIWPEGTDPKSVKVKSLHENHVRHNESVTSTLGRIDGVMEDYQCDLEEALEKCKIQGPTASKIKTVYDRLCDEARKLLGGDSKIGVSVAYEVAKGTQDPELQVRWLNEHIAGRMTRDAIKNAAASTKTTRSVSKRTVSSKTGTVEVVITYQGSDTHQSIAAAMTQMNRQLQGQCRRETPVDLLSRFIK